MTKQEFLKKLDKKLNILSEEERKDTISEYEAIIDEKIAHGAKEEDAVKEAGNVDELAKEILNAYKINPDYKKTEKTIAESTEEAIKKGAKKLSEMTEEVVDNIKNTEFELTTQNVFEITIKVILVLFALAFLKIPFYIISSLVTSIFHYGIFGELTSFIFKVIIELAYLIICILIILSLVHKYTKGEKESNQREPVKKKINNQEKRSYSEKRVSKTGVSDIVMLIVKMFVILCVIIPLFCVMLGLSVTMAFAIYLIVKGINISGILVLVIGLLLLTASFIAVVFDLMNGKKIKYYSFLISFIVSLVGGFMTLDYIAGFTYINDLDETKYGIVTKEYEETITRQTHVYFRDLTIDDTLADNQIIVSLTYSSDYLGVRLVRRELSDYTVLEVNRDIIKAININKDILEDIKNQKLYDYSLLSDVRVTVRANQVTADYLR